MSRFGVRSKKNSYKGVFHPTEFYKNLLIPFAQIAKTTGTFFSNGTNDSLLSFLSSDAFLCVNGRH